MKIPAKDRLITLLSSRYASIIVLLISIAGRVIQKFIFSGLDDDKCYQIQATKNFLAGNGISTYEVFASNLSNAVYTPLIKWPPGYSIILSPFYALSRNDFFWGSLWPDLISSVLFVWLARKIILQFALPIWLVNLYTLVTGFFFYDFVSSRSSDLITLVSFQVALLLTLKFFQSTEKKYSQALLIVLFLFICCLLRYMYIPLAMVIPAYIFLSGVMKPDRVLLRRGIFMLVALILPIGCFLLFQKLNSGAPAYVYPTEKGFFPQNLLRINPFLFSSAGHLAVATTMFHQLSGIEYIPVAKVIKYIHLALLLSLLFLSMRWILTKKWLSGRLDDHFICITILSSLAVLGILSYLSLAYYPVQLLTGYSWTYVSEGRYYAVPVFLIQMGIFIGIYKYFNIKKVYRFIKFLLLVSILISAFHGFYFTGKKVIEGNRNFFKKKELITLDSCRQLFHQFVKDNAGKDIVCASGDPMFNNFASLWENIPGLYDFRKLNTMELNTKKETVLFVPVKHWYSLQLTGFLNNPHKRYIGQIDDWTFYSINIKPKNKYNK